jgi:PHD/YefM family antitoxin component YafN of YafNO toxin-antitoxin module
LISLSGYTAKLEAQMLDLKQLNIKYVTNETGERTAVILSVEEFQELLEDIDDLAAIAERHTESTTSHGQVIAELKQDGAI